jgi:3-oxocholest-4-en-26-oyl-CoA dehydrogenase alpha subunit
LQRVAKWATETKRGQSKCVIDDPIVRARLAQIAIDNEIGGLLSLRAAIIASKGGQPTIEGAVAKLFASEAYVSASEWCSEIVGADGLLEAGQPDAPANGWTDRAAKEAPMTTIYGGTSEIQKNVIAERHLGLPRAR